MPGAFKLDHMQLIEPILCWKIFNFLAFILGGQFLLPQRANNGKRDSPNLKFGYDRGVSVPGAFKINHMQLIEPILC